MRATPTPLNKVLILAAAMSALAALLHVGCIYFGASWYRFFGAGEHMATLAEKGSMQPTLITSGIALVLAIWSAYALSAAGLINRLPFVRLVVSLITLVYLIRAIVGFVMITSPMGRSEAFWLWSSLICLIFGVTHLVGLKQQWRRL